MSDASCKICRRAGEKLFLKGDRCLTPKCAVVRKPYPPGIHAKKKIGGRRGGSEFSLQLKEKQKLRNLYQLGEHQFHNYVEAATKASGYDAGEELLRLLTERLDNVVLQAGFAVSRSIARQLVSHGHILVDGRAVHIPSYRVANGNVLSLSPRARSSGLTETVKQTMENHTPPEWISLNAEAYEATITAPPRVHEQAPLYNTKVIIEYYAR